MPDPEEYKAFRDGIVDVLRHEIFGPGKDDPDEIRHEELDVSPLQIYGTGILFPQRLQQDLLEDDPAETAATSPPDPESPSSDDETDETVHVDDAGDRRVSDIAPDAGVEDQPLNLANEFSPSAVGITFKAKGTKHLFVEISFGTYDPIQVKEPHPRAGQLKADGARFPETRTFNRYRRTPWREKIEIPLDFSDSKSRIFPVPGTHEGLQLHATLRAVDGDESIISLMLVNHSKSSSQGYANTRNTFFQTEFEVHDISGAAVFTHIDRPSGNSSEDELASMDLLYRHRRAFCLGHGCAGDWRRGLEVERSRQTDMVRTASIPTYEVHPVEPRENAYGTGSVKLSMRFLSEGRGAREEKRQDSILQSLENLCADYELWIRDCDKEAEKLTGKMAKTAYRHLVACRKCLERMRQGISVLGASEDATPLQAFRLANRAMLMQQFHTRLEARALGSDFPSIPEDYNEEPEVTRAWRPFQLAFILMNIAGVTDVGHPDHKVVDLIWFPTGGGKTEAYLGVAAYMICLRRLRTPENAGTTVMMRYTLRLLTSQQFQRASTLILSLDMLRREKYLGSDLGAEPISIGLWVGQSLSPNRRDAARAALTRMRRERGRADNPFQMLQCPWCKTPMNNRDHYGYVDERTGPGQSRTVRFRCPDDSCPWGSRDRHLPILVIDEDIYETPPTLLLGTVDKFAQVAWNDRTGRLFGIGLDHDPPELIIQDELHLISGPLGTIVGHYETAIERFCSRDGRVPKIVASTATIRQAHDQCHALYNRSAFEFPPQGMKAGDSYFAFENSEAPGRLYVGIFGSGLKSHATAQIRACSALLQASVPLPSRPSEQGAVETADADTGTNNSDEQQTLARGTYFPLADPYGTLVWYFNSLRELGHATTMCTGDIPEHIKGMCRRDKVPWDYRRRIRNYVELTSRRTADEIPDILEQLERSWQPKPDGRAPVDILLSTNMISVGVDVQRLGLMVVCGQPKSTSEYIQATSRVGRKYPGLVVAVYHQGKSRDRSHYEQFVAYHQSFYRYVEATSVTPFSPSARERALRGILIALARLAAGVSEPRRISEMRAKVEQELSVILNRVRDIDPDEEVDTKAELLRALDQWERVLPEEYGRMAGKVGTMTLAYPYGAEPDPVFQQNAWPILTSMRNVDSAAEAKVISAYEADDSDAEKDEAE